MGSSHAATVISIINWPDNQQCFAVSDIADVVVETFACNPPATYIEAMSQASKPVAWINLEYLSAESWVESHHGIPSPHPRYALTKHFYFPGFTSKTGGLLREPGLMNQLQALEIAQAQRKPAPLRIFLFSYQQPAIEAWLESLDATGSTILCVAPCPARPQIMQWNATRSTTRNLSIEALAFVAQHEFDTLLSGFDMMFVRGEDSFVRAQWSAKPLVWHIYPQEEEIHLVKLRAFYDRYLDQGVLTTSQRSIYWRFVLAWNHHQHNDTPETLADLWPQLTEIYPALLENARVWCYQLIRQPDLVSQLRDFVSHLVKC